MMLSGSKVRANFAEVLLRFLSSFSFCQLLLDHFVPRSRRPFRATVCIILEMLVTPPPIQVLRPYLGPDSSVMFTLQVALSPVQPYGHYYSMLPLTTPNCIDLACQTNWKCLSLFRLP